MQVTVKVKRDNAGIYDPGYNRMIPTDVQILGMVTIEDPCVEGSKQQVLRITHHSFETWLGIEGTANDLIDKINTALCCDESGGLPQLPTPEPVGMVAGDEQITYNFVGLSNPPAGIIYQIQASDNSWISVAGIGSGPASPITIKGLQNGVPYAAHIRATAPGYQPSDWVNFGGTATPVGLPRAVAPSAGIVNDVADTFAFTLAAGKPNPADYEYSILGSPYAPMTAFPLYVGDRAVPAGQVLVRTKGTAGTTAPSLPITNLTPFTKAASAVFVLMYLTEDTNTVPTEAYVQANAMRITVPVGSDYFIPFTNTAAKYLLVFEPASEPLKEKNGDPGSGGDAFGPQGLFPVGGVSVGSLRGYISLFKTVPGDLEFNS